jgi:hypothetical protein
MLTLILTYLTVFLGLVAGVILAFIAKEELPTAKKHFIFLRDILVTLIMLFLLYFYDLNKIIIMIVTILTFLTLINLKLEKDNILYLILSIVLMLTYKDKTFFLIESILVFLYGFPAGTLFAMKHMKNIKELIKTFLTRYIWFFIPLIFAGYL